MEVCLVSREVAPFGGGGIGVYVTELARVLVEAGAGVRILTGESLRAPYEALRNEGRLPYDERVRWTFARDPTMRDAHAYAGWHHARSAFVFAALEEAYADEAPPDLVEFPDYGGEGFVTLQAKRSNHHLLRDTRICLRLHTSNEMGMALNGHLGEDFETQSLSAIERYCLEHADTVLWAGGDVLGTYERFYGWSFGARALQLRHPVTVPPAAPGEGRGREDDEPLRFLYFGRLERRKGVEDLVRAFARHPWRDWRLTFLGADTDTGELGTSMRAQLELATLGDDRVSFVDAVPRDELPRVIRDHDAVLMPSRWECWPYAALETLALGRPVVATPVGGLNEIVRHGETGWLASDATPQALAAVVGRLLDDPAAVDAVAASGEPRRHVLALAPDDEIAEGYRRLAAAPAPRPAAPRRSTPPLASIVVPYFRMAEHVEEAVRSAAEQTYPNVEIIVVNDGSLEPEDDVLRTLVERFGVRLLRQPNLGLSHARNNGISVSRGRYLFPLDADNIAEPTFLERCVELLEADPSLAYVTSWSRFIDEHGRALSDLGGEEGYEPLGNFTHLADQANWAGDAAAVWPRRLFDIGLRYRLDRPVGEDWMLYRTMRARGHIGHVIPERLIRYRVRAGSMLQEGRSKADRLQQEITTELGLERVRWTAPRRA